MEEQDMVDEEEIWAELKKAEGAMSSLGKAREQEGEALKTDLLDKLREWTKM